MGIIGIVLGYLFLLFSCRKNKFSYDDTAFIYTWSCLGALAGAKVLYIFQNIRPIVRYLVNDPAKLYEKAKNIATGGFVFYGGLFGAILGAAIASRFFRVSVQEKFNSLIPILPLDHGFGRIGCYLTGCCYGREYNGPFSIHYTNSLYAPNHVSLFPIQLVEGIFDFCLFIVLYSLEIRNQSKKIVDYYLVSYASFRFLAEFARGDIYRGYIYKLSLSQWISIFIIVIELGKFFVRKRRDG